MTNSSHNAKGILYITPPRMLDSAVSVNITRRTLVIRKLGYTVIEVIPTPSSFIRTCLRIWKMRKSFKRVIIRLDGACVLDKYTLLKCILPQHTFIWEIHGYPEERLELDQTFRTKLGVLKNNLRRRILSCLVAATIFISEELLLYARTKMFVHNPFVIQNFILSSRKTRVATIPAPLHHILQNTFIVLWGGDPSLPWNAIDTIQRVAARISADDKTILFILVGSHHFYPAIQRENILYLDAMPHTAFTLLIKKADVCLALYHKLNHVPFYLHSMKLLDYLAHGKPVIATNIGSAHKLIRSGITGFLTNNAEKDIANKILLLKRDAALARKLGQNGLRVVSALHNESFARMAYNTALGSIE